MPRSLRNHVAGETVHVVARGVDHGPIFRDDHDREQFLGRLPRIFRQRRWRCLTYCLMGNHYHLVLRLDAATLSEGMQDLNGTHGRAFNQRYGRSGHLFEGRFWSKPVRSEAHFFGLARYVALNPVRAGLCASAEKWPWSAHRALLGADHSQVVDTEAMLEHFGDDLSSARGRYESMVNGTEMRSEELLACPSRNEAIEAGADAGLPPGRIAGMIGCHPLTVVRALARAA